LLVEICNIRGNYVRDDYGKEELRKGIANFTYKSCSGTILGFNDYGWKSSILVQYIKIISKHSRWPENRRSMAKILTPERLTHKSLVAGVGSGLPKIFLDPQQLIIFSMRSPRHGLDGYR
jgi:hypothetical protein